MYYSGGGAGRRFERSPFKLEIKVLPHLVEQRNVFSVIKNVMQIIPIQSFHDDYEVMWFLGYLERIEFGILGTPWLLFS